MLDYFIQQKLPWLKVDFDRLKHESDTEEEDKLLDKQDISCQDILRTKARMKVPHEKKGFKIRNFSNRSGNFSPDPVLESTEGGVSSLYNWIPGEQIPVRLSAPRARSADFYGLSMKEDDDIYHTLLWSL